MTYQKVAKIR